MTLPSPLLSSPKSIPSGGRTPHALPVCHPTPRPPYVCTVRFVLSCPVLSLSLHSRSRFAYNIPRLTSGRPQLRIVYWPAHWWSDCCRRASFGIAMSSNPPAVATSSKATASTGSLSPAQNVPGAIATGDSYGHRRSGGSSFGAATTARSSPTPRSNQQSKKQHKASKRFRQPDEDALAESVSRPLRCCCRYTQANTRPPARNAFIQQSQGPDVHYPPHELQSASTPTESPQQLPSRPKPEKSDLGFGIGLSRH